MSTVNTSNLAELRALWIVWRKNLIRLRRKRRTSLNPDAYLRIHQELKLACRRCPPSEARIANQVSNLVGAWGSLQILKNSEGHVLKALDSKCEAIDHQLGFSPYLIDGLIRYGVSGVLALAAVAFGWTWSQGTFTPEDLAWPLQLIGAKLVYHLKLQANNKLAVPMLGIATVLVVGIGAMLTMFRKKT